MNVVIATSGSAPRDRSRPSSISRQVRADVPMRFSTVERDHCALGGEPAFHAPARRRVRGVALLLATLGVYSVISYLVAQRGREISIRVALGAHASDIVRLVVRQGVALALLGAVVGAVAAFASTRVLKSLLYSVSTTDPLAFAACSSMLCVVALVASYLPARRASRLEPMDVLRGG